MAPADFNQQIIDEFRSNGGVVGGPFAGAPLLLLHTVGRKTGKERINPLAYQKVDAGWAIFASFAGAPTNPAWYDNLMARADATVEVGTDTLNVAVREATGDERDRIWARQKEVMPGFAEYEEKAGGRIIPVVVLEPR
ncbi:MAG TPA: nitroreductase family deazaflavin-dependent oxidoreductase [Acidimicrobiales bacterium]|jgi:deazaflavin-dependent oxidoreductase (nitroreductase family)|nr:nitroreductase family deazaflavin-dependent oxidoreductase [Acidimicrobiales bacterium]